MARGNERNRGGRPNADGETGKVPNYLKGRARKALAKQARKTVNSAYRPDLQALKRQRKRESSIWKKRKADLEYYKQWLDTRQREWDANAREADDMQREAIIASNASTMEAYEKLRSQMITNAEPGVSDPSQSKAFDVSQAGGLANQANEAFAKFAEQAMKDNAETREGVQSNTRAYMVGLAGQAASDHWNRVKDISDTRQKLLSERRRDRIAEEGRLLEVEIEKAKVRADIRLKKKELRLRNKALNIDDANADADRAVDQQNADTREKEARQGGDTNGDGKVDEVDLRARKKQSREWTSNINGAIQLVQSAPEFKKERLADNRLSREGRQIMKTKLNKAGIPSHLVQAVMDVWFTGGLRNSTKKHLKSQGYIVPKIWR